VVTAALPALCALFGLTVGSFLNVVVHRVPQHRSVVSPPSACPGCGTVLAGRDLVPVVSWLALRGRCRSCHAPVSARYPLVEALTAGLWLAVALRFGVSWTLPAELVFVSGLVALAAVDLEHYLLPKAVVYPTLALVGAGLVAAAAATGRWERLGVAAACGVAAFLVLFAIHASNPAWMGFGDVRLAGVLGVALGWIGPWYPVVGFMAANLLGAAVGVVLVAAGRAGRKTALPYGVFLAAGSVVAILSGAPIVSAAGAWLHR
jgi:leader peptidase (prepilin peptidase)/N-methyltransferase